MRIIKNKRIKLIFIAIIGICVLLNGNKVEGYPDTEDTLGKVVDKDGNYIKEEGPTSDYAAASRIK